MTQFVATDPQGRILYGVGRPDSQDFAGAPDLRPLPRGGTIFYAWQGHLDFDLAPSANSEYRWDNGAPTWFDLSPLIDHQQRALDVIDAAGEAVRMAVITKLTQTSEYQRAEQHAREYRAAGYLEGEDAYVPPAVASWAQAKWREGWTARQAADDILATADSWYAVLDDIRALRLANKEDVRAASSAAEIAAICDDMEGDMRAIAQQLQLTLTN